MNTIDTQIHYIKSLAVPYYDCRPVPMPYEEIQPYKPKTSSTFDPKLVTTTRRLPPYVRVKIHGMEVWLKVMNELMRGK